MHPHLSRHMSKDFVTVLQLHPKHRVREGLGYLAPHLNHIVLVGHAAPSTSLRPRMTSSSTGFEPVAIRSRRNPSSSRRPSRTARAASSITRFTGCRCRGFFAFGDPADRCLPSAMWIRPAGSVPNTTKRSPIQRPRRTMTTRPGGKRSEEGLIPMASGSRLPLGLRGACTRSAPRRSDRRSRRSTRWRGCGHPLRRS